MSIVNVNSWSMCPAVPVLDTKFYADKRAPQNIKIVLNQNASNEANSKRSTPFETLAIPDAIPFEIN